MELIPLFPLELVVFPLEKLNLHIFEPRYRQLIKECKLHNSPFGIPTFRKGHPLDFGCLVKLESIEKEYADGRMDIRTKGLQVFRIKKYLDVHPNKLYPGGSIQLINLDFEEDESIQHQIRERILDLYDVMKIASFPQALENEQFHTTQIAHKVAFNFEQEYNFLQIHKEKDRQKYMLHHLNTLIPIAREMEEMRKKIQLNGHFKDILPPKV